MAKLQKGKTVVETDLPREIKTLQAQGFTEVKESAPKGNDTTSDASKSRK